MLKNRNYFEKVVCSLFLFVITNAAFSQEKPTADTSAKQPPSKSTSAVKPYKDVVTSKAITTKGLFIIHKIEDKYLFEIPEKLLNKELLVVGRISKAPVDADILAGMNPKGYLKRTVGYAGDEISNNVIEFVKGPRNKLYIQSDYFYERANDSSDLGLWKAMQNNNLQPLVMSFDIKAYTTDSSAVVIDATEFMNGDNNILFFDNDAKKKWNLTSVMSDRSFIEAVKNFPANVEIKTVKTYKSGDSYNTYALNTSIIVLPDQLMRTSFYNPRIPYKSIYYHDFDYNKFVVEEKKMIYRWNLQPADKDMDRFKKGELVEPKNPIVIYIDPATPKQWVPYFIQGVNDWQSAFERAGFKNAIVAKMAPENSSWDMENVKYSAIVYKPSARTEEEDETPYIADPRTGEIIETHINFYHSELEEMYKSYFIACGNVDPRVGSKEVNDALMGELIRSNIAHKVGHALGLAHNLSASCDVPVENLRNEKWLATNGIAPSIMDMLPYNYVAQPGDKISPKNLIPRVGAYDNWAIQYGYQYKDNFKNPTAEKVFYDKWIADSIARNPLLAKAGENNKDPRCQFDDLGDNIMKANAYGIKNLKTMLPQLAGWTKDPIKGYQWFAALYKAGFLQYKSLIMQTTGFIGGIEADNKLLGQPGNTFKFTSRARQKEAVSFLNEYFFTTPKWFFSKEYFELTAGALTQKTFAGLQNDVLDRILANDRLNMMEVNEDVIGKDAYTIPEYFNDLKKFIFSELSQHQAIDPLKKVLQKQYVSTLCEKITPGATKTVGPNMKMDITVPATTAAYVFIKTHLRTLMNELKSASKLYADATTKAHLADMAEKINFVFNVIKGEVKAN